MRRNPYLDIFFLFFSLFLFFLFRDEAAFALHWSTDNRSDAHHSLPISHFILLFCFSLFSPCPSLPFPFPFSHPHLMRAAVIAGPRGFEIGVDRMGRTADSQWAEPERQSGQGRCIGPWHLCFGTPFSIHHLSPLFYTR